MKHSITRPQKRLFVDCQVFQYETWNRGMGRYTLKLLEALDKEALDLTLILNKNIGIDRKRLKLITEACPAASKIYLRLPDDPNKFGGWQRIQKACATELDRQLKGILGPLDTYLIASHFALRYCSVFPNITCKKALIFYDLTPYLHWSDYKDTPDFEPKKYFAQFETLFKADQLWAISQSAADEVKYWLGIDARKVYNIRGASIRNLHERSYKPPYVVADHFLLCPSADGPNKNNENMVRAFADFNQKSTKKYKLVITSGFSDRSKIALSAISDDVIFSGHVSDGELSWLYQHCEALLFMSKTEGLGLPILEAVTAKKKVICSDLPVFREISDKAFYFADPADVQSISSALHRALIATDTWEAKRKYYTDIDRIFTWDAVALTCLRLMDDSAHDSDVTGRQQVFCYADSDNSRRARDVTEVLYPLNQGAEFRALRGLEYTHTFPSYLLEMGAATPALDGDRMSTKSKAVYMIDGSQEAAQLLFYALQTPGLIIILFQDTRSKKIDEYLKKNFNKKLTHEMLIRLIRMVGNQIVYRPDFSPRGTEQFINEVGLLDRQLLKERSLN